MVNQNLQETLPPQRDISPELLKSEILAKLAYSVGKDPIAANSNDWLTATILVVRDHIIDRWMATTRENSRAEKKRVYYLSLEFLIGRLMRDAMNNLELTEGMTQALTELNVDIDFIRELEPDAALGNGGLGRLAFNPTTHGVDGGNEHEQGQERRHERRQNPSSDRDESHEAF